MSSYTINSKNLDKNKVFILQKSELEKRYDPQFYKQEYKDNLEKIKRINHKRLGEVVKFSTETWNQKDFFDSTFPYIEISEIDTISGEIQNIVQVEKEKAASRAKMIVRENDIIISTTRPNRGAISLIRKEQDFSIASTGFSVIRNITNPKIDREYLFTILRQQIILKQFEQRSSGGNYPAITQEELCSVTIPLPEKEIQKKIVKVFNGCFAQKQKNEAEAEKLLSSIDDYLLNELGIKLPEPPENTLKNRMFVANFKSIESRLDPQFYLTYFTELENAIKSSPNKTLRLDTIFEINRGGSPRPIHNFLTEDENGYNWVKIGDTKNNDKYIYQTADKIIPEGARYSRKVEVGDFILSNSMSFGRPYIMQIEGYIHDGWLLFKPKFSDFNADYFHSILSSKLIYQLFKKATIGGVVENLNIDLVKKVSIPVPPIDKQKEIVEHITGIRQQAQQLKDKTTELLKKASEEIEKILLD